MLKQKTYFDQNDDFADIGAKAIRHTIITFKNLYDRFWNRDPLLIVESLNQNVPLALSRFHENTAIGNFHNSIAAQIGIVERIPVVMPSNFSFDSENFVFVYTPPTQPDVEEEPEE